MKNWTKVIPLDWPQKTQGMEIWEYRDNNEKIASFEVEVTTGKSLDILALKDTSIKEVRDYAAFLNDTARDIYAAGRKKNKIIKCPCCETDTHDAIDALSVFGVRYSRCRQCGHAFVATQPSREILSDVFKESDEHSAVYTDTASVKIRLEQVVKPKRDWLLRIYRQYYGCAPECLLDVGAGGGHFVEVCRHAGIKTEGYEISKASRRFAAEVFGVDLLGKDFLSENTETGKFDIITFWGLLEYVTEPGKFLKTAGDLLASVQMGMLVVEVPRFDCISTAIQSAYPYSVARHLDPTTHINCFSDSSLATVLYESGFKPVAAWYFGMDAYELLIQLALQLEGYDVMEKTSPIIPGLQSYFDGARLCDDIIIAAVPLTK